MKDIKQKLHQQMNPQFFRETWIEVNLQNIKNNIREFKNRLSKGTKIYAVVKANAYGHGDVVVANAAIEAGADALSVATLDEAIKLRNFGYEVPILVMGWSRPEDAPLAADLNISLAVFQKDWLEAAMKENFENKLKIHLKLDTGMGRIGISTEQQIDDFLSELKKLPIQLQGVFTHFSNAENENIEFYKSQNEKFNKLLEHIRSVWKLPFIVHSGNSAASIRFPNEMHDYVRCGIAMYGLYPSEVLAKEKMVDLKPAMSLYSRIAHVKCIKKGDSVSYGRTYKAEEDNEWIATLPLGYSDGYRRGLQGQEVLIDGKRMPIVGRICMDQLMVKLDKEYPVGTKVTLLGQDGKDCITADQIAKRLGTINYEIPCMMGVRIPRTYQINRRLE